MLNAAKESVDSFGVRLLPIIDIAFSCRDIARQGPIASTLVCESLYFTTYVHTRAMVWRHSLQEIMCALIYIFERW